jgi:hypothetical protein
MSFVSVETVRRVSLNTLDWRIVIAQVSYTSCTHRRTHERSLSTCHFTATFTGTESLPELWLSVRGKFHSLQWPKSLPNASVLSPKNEVFRGQDARSFRVSRETSDFLMKSLLVAICSNEYVCHIFAIVRAGRADTRYSFLWRVIR